MSWAASWLGSIILGSLFAALVMTSVLLLAPELRRRVHEPVALGLERDIRFLRLRLEAGPLVWAWLFVLVGAASLSPFQPVLGLLLLGGCGLVKPVLTQAKARRVEALEGQSEAWLSALARALEAAPSLGEALEVSSTMVDAPMREELKEVVSETSLGTPLDRALGHFAARAESRVIDICVATIALGRLTGGELPDVLRSSATSLREMTRLEGVLRSKTAEGRMQAMVISLVPAPLYLVLRLLDPQFFLPLEQTRTGHLLLGVVVLLWVASSVLARKILAVQL